MSDFRLAKEINEKLQIIFCFTNDYLELDLEQHQEFKGWHIRPTVHPCRVSGTY